MEWLLLDLRYALRALRKSPSFTIATIAILGLGIGANVTIFSLIDAVLLRPPAEVREPGRLVSLYTSDFSGPRYGTSSFPDYRDFRDRADVFEGVMAHAPRPFSVSDGVRSERGIGFVVTANYFSLLGVRPVVGRGFLETDDLPGGAPVAVISHEFWQGHYTGDSAVIGRALRLGGQPFTIVGVAPPHFAGLVRGPVADVWIPSGAAMVTGEDVRRLESRGDRGLFVTARLLPDRTLAGARAEMQTIAGQLFAEHPDNWIDVKGNARVVSVLPLSESLVFPAIRGPVAGFMTLLMVVVGLVLLIACANVANLMLAKTAARRKEIAIRVSLGAARARIMRQLLTESLLLGAAAGAAGLTLTSWLAGAINRYRPPTPVPLALSVVLDWRVVAFAVTMSLVTTIGFGLAPALELARPDVQAALKDGAVTGRARQRLRNTLVVVQMAVSLILLVGGGLLIRALRSGQAIDPGIEADRALMMGVNLELQGYDEARGRTFYRALLERVRTLPGVETAALGSQVPLNPFGGERRGTAIEGYPRRQGEDLEFNDNFVTPDYFRTLGVAVVAGRSFTEADDPGAPPVAMVNETFARRFWPGATPLGKRLSVSGHEGPWLTIVGVVRDGKYGTLGEEAKPYFLLPLAQHYQGGVNLFVRTRNHPAELLGPVREAFKALDRDLPVYDVKTMQEHVNTSLLPQRIAASLLGALGVAALILASLGIYSVIAYSVSQRTREIGIRVALGARGEEVVGLVVKQGMRLVTIGTGIGLVVAGGVSHLIRSLLYGISAIDPVTFIGVAIGLAGVALLACYLPARRASRVDPVVVLRNE